MTIGIKKFTTIRPHGYEIVTDRESDNIIREADTIQCCHCGCHWTMKPGSGITRGFCYKCNALTCGHPRCGNHDNSIRIIR